MPARSGYEASGLLTSDSPMDLAQYLEKQATLLRLIKEQPGGAELLKVIDVATFSYWVQSENSPAQVVNILCGSTCAVPERKDHEP